MGVTTTVGATYLKRSERLWHGALEVDERLSAGKGEGRAAAKVDCHLGGLGLGTCRGGGRRQASER